MIKRNENRILMIVIHLFLPQVTKFQIQVRPIRGQKEFYQSTRLAVPKYSNNFKDLPKDVRTTQLHKSDTVGYNCCPKC